MTPQSRGPHLEPGDQSRRTGWRAAGIPAALTSGGGLIGYLIGRSVEVPLPSAFWDLAAQPLATAAAGAGAITAGYLALHNGSKTRALDAQHHTDTMNRDRVADFRSRYTTAAQQIGNTDSAAIREAGIYAISALVDDWLRYGEDSDQRALSHTQARACVNLLCSYLRANRDLDTFQSEGRTEIYEDFPRAELSVRNTVVGVLRDHLSSWQSTDLAWRDEGHLTNEPNVFVDLSGAVLRNADLSGVRLRGAKLKGTNLTYATLQGVDLTDANMRGADLSFAEISHAHFTRAKLRGATFIGTRIADATFDGADLKSAMFTDVKLVDVSLRQALGIRDALFTGTCVYTEETTWPYGFTKPGTIRSRAFLELMERHNDSLLNHLATPDAPTGAGEDS